MSTTTRRALFALPMLGVAAWLGCNDILGIDDPEYVPFGEAGTFNPTADGGGPDGSFFNGPVVPARRAARIPPGETIKIEVNVNPGAAVGLLNDLKLSPLVTQDVQVTQAVAPTGRNRFILTFVAKPDAKPVDEKLTIRAVTDREEDIGSAELRVLVGTTGTYDTSYGNQGVATIEAPVQSNFVVSFGSGTTIIASDNHDVIEVTRDGEQRRVATIDLKNDCSVTALAADPGAFFLAGYCGPAGAEVRFVSQGDLTPTPGAPSEAGPAVVPITNIPQRDLYLVARLQDAGWYVSESDSGVGSRLIGRTPNGVNTLVPVDYPTWMAPADGGFAIFRNDALESYVARMGGLPFGTVTSFGTNGVAKVAVAAGADPEPRITGTTTSNGNVIVVTSVNNAAVTDDHVFVHVFDPGGQPAGNTVLDGVDHASVAADKKNRFIVATETNNDGNVLLNRYSATAQPDPSLPRVTPIKNCKNPLVGIDDETMIVVYCGTPTGSFVHRFWP